MNRRTSVSAGRTLGGIFIDYEGTHVLLGQQHESPHELIHEIVANIRTEFDTSYDVETVLVRAYADFSMVGPDGIDIQEALDIQGYEPRFVSRARQRNATEVQLCVDAMEMLHQRDDINTFILVTGNRLYLPLISQLRRYGRDVVLVSLASAAADVASTDPGFRSINMETYIPRVRPGGVGARSGHNKRPSSDEYQSRVQHHPVTDDGALRALEIIERHFGQYEEVYLTPLLRKLSEVMNDDRYDPKVLINTLEESGAVWLEKRRGTPHDYTVLLVDVTHPDVQAAQEKIESTPDYQGDGSDARFSPSTEYDQAYGTPSEALPDNRGSDGSHRHQDELTDGVPDESSEDTSHPNGAEPSKDGSTSYDDSNPRSQ